MGVEIVWSSTTSYAATSSVVQEPVAHSLVSQVAPASPVANWELFYLTNVGDQTAQNCGFYISPSSRDINPNAISDFSTILSWSANAAEYGVYTIFGAAITDFENVADPDYHEDFSQGGYQHTYTRGVRISNRIALTGADGVSGDQISPISDSGSQPKLYILVKIPDGETPATLSFVTNFYYEEPV